jgi:tetratricopeptide (TPR) repeat protein
MQAAFKARSILSKAETLSQKSSKINDAIFTAISEVVELDYKCFFWQPVTKISELFDYDLDTESGKYTALKTVDMMVDNILSSEYANIPDLLAKAYIYKAKLNLMLGNYTEALEICNLAREGKPNVYDSDVIYGIMADICKMQNNRQLSRKYRIKSKGIVGGSKIIYQSLMSWGDQWQNNPYLDDRFKFFMVKIVTPIRMFLVFFSMWIILTYLTLQLGYKIGMDSVIIRGFINAYEYISHQHCIEVNEVKKMIYCFKK